jgi:squalene synthase HpnD
MSDNAIAARECQQARAIATKSSFYLAMRVLDPERRDAMYAIYAFCRAVDDIADEDGDRALRSAQLDEWRKDLDELYAGRVHQRCAYLAEPKRRFNLQREDFEAVIDGMAMDVEENIRAPDWNTLDLYCDRVASAVGRLSVRVFGIPGESGRLLAHHLGRALQLTNILRDLDEDAERGRLYLPREALERAGVDVPDHAAFRRNRLNAENVIDSKSIERASSEKPVPTFFASRALAHSRAGVWIVEDMVAAEIGLPYGRGFEAFGLDPKRLVLARARRPRETLWAMEEALKTSGAIVIAETWMAPEAYDLATSRRLLLAARAGGGTGLLLLLRAAGEARRLSSAAHLRFEVGSVPVGRAAAARRLPLPRPPLWRLRIAKARASLLSALGDFDPLAWRDIAFDPEKTVFRHAFPQRLPPPPFDRPNFERRRRESA